MVGVSVQVLSCLKEELTYTTDKQLCVLVIYGRHII